MKLKYAIIPLCWMTGNSCAQNKALPQTLGLPPIVAEKVHNLRDRIINIGLDVLNSEAVTENTVISPVSIVGGFYMLAAATSGLAHNEILDLLDIPKGSSQAYESYKVLIEYLLNQNDRSYILNIANGLFYQEGLAPQASYTEILNKLMKTNFADIGPINFRNAVDATTTVNNWVNQKTKGKIEKLFKNPIDSRTFALLLSSLYFKGSWEAPFETISHNYYCWKVNSAECSTSVQFMSTDNHFNTYWGKELMVIDIPLTLLDNCEDKESCLPDNSKISKFMKFKLWLPSTILSTKEDHEKFVEKIRTKSVKIESKMEEKRINLVMPKLSMKFNKDLKSTFQNMNVNEVFNYGNHFTPIFGDQITLPSAVSEIRHAVKLDIDEKGIEGAAATAIGMMFRSMPPEVVVNRPFYFSIESDCQTKRENKWAPRQPDIGDKNCPHDRTPIFIGKMVNPLQ